MSVNHSMKLQPEDRRWRAIEQVMQRHDYRPDGLIETLHAAHDAFGYLDNDTLDIIAARLHTPPAKVFGVATFYNHFSLKPKGDHTLSVCTGTACHVKGNDRLLVWLHTTYKLAPGETTLDNRLSLVEVRCVGACALAPVFLTDGQLHGKLDSSAASTSIEEWLNDAA